MSNQKYDRVEVLTVMEEFFCNTDIESIASHRFDYVYEDILEYAHNMHKNIKMPAYSQMRKIVISFLKECGLIKDTERLTARKAYEITKCFYDADNIDEVLLNEYKVSVCAVKPIICTIKLPPIEILDRLAKGFSNEKNGLPIWKRIDIIYQLCQQIKQKNEQLILAVIPEFNRMVYLNEKDKKDSINSDFDVLCDTVCMFVKNTPDGRAFVESMKHNKE